MLIPIFFHLSGYHAAVHVAQNRAYVEHFAYGARNGHVGSCGGETVRPEYYFTCMWVTGLAELSSTLTCGAVTNPILHLNYVP